VQQLDPKTVNALHWIVGIFNKHNVSYRIGGGFAAKMYGSPRPLGDIDFGLSEKYFQIILPEISQYITFCPTHWNGDGKWDCEMMCLSYHDQEIDISGTDILKMSNKERTSWIDRSSSSFDTVDFDIDGITVKVMNPHELVKYKKELDGGHQLFDIKAIQKYITEHHL
jgi:hypothetical protein